MEKQAENTIAFSSIKCDKLTYTKYKYDVLCLMWRGYV